MPLRRWIGTEPVIVTDVPASRPFRRFFGGPYYAGDTMAWITPPGKVWHVVSVWLRLGTDANVADRKPVLYINDHLGPTGYKGVAYLPGSQPTVANSVGFYTWSPGLDSHPTTLATAAYETNAFPAFDLHYGQGLQLVVFAEQAGDNYIVNVLVEEYDE